MQDTRVDSPPPGEGFLAVSEELGRLESGLEASDAAPTAPQAEARAALRARLDMVWTAWTRLRDGAVAGLGPPLTAAGATPVIIPPEDRLKITLPDDGEDLP